MKRLLIVVTIITIQFASLGFAQEDVKESEPPNPECGDFSACFNAAAMSFSQRDYAGAIALFTRASEFGDDNQKAVCKTNIGNAWYNTGLALSQAGNYEDAIKAFNSALDNGLNTIDVYMFRGYAYLFFEKYQQAVLDFDSVLSVVPDNRRAIYLKFIANLYIDTMWMNEDIEKWFKEHPVQGFKSPTLQLKYRSCSRNLSAASSISIMGKITYLDTFSCLTSISTGSYLADKVDPVSFLPERVEDAFFTPDDYAKAYYPVERGGIKPQLSSPEAYTMRGKAFLQAKNMTMP